MNFFKGFLIGILIFVAIILFILLLGWVFTTFGKIASLVFLGLAFGVLVGGAMVIEGE